MISGNATKGMSGGVKARGHRRRRPETQADLGGQGVRRAGRGGRGGRGGRAARLTSLAASPAAALAVRVVHAVEDDEGAGEEAKLHPSAAGWPLAAAATGGRQTAADRPLAQRRSLTRPSADAPHAPRLLASPSSCGRGERERAVRKPPGRQTSPAASPATGPCPGHPTLRPELAGGRGSRARRPPSATAPAIGSQPL